MITCTIFWHIVYHIRKIHIMHTYTCDNFFTVCNKKSISDLIKDFDITHTVHMNEKSYA